MSGLVLVIAYRLHPCVGLVTEAVMTYWCLATKALYRESHKVYVALKNSGLDEGRKAVSMIVGRDTDALDEAGVIKATVETVAENTSDGVIAPMLYLALGGPVLGMAYKAINTIDSMIGYQNDRFLDFGRCGARLDDAVNFIPSRISAILMICACACLGSKYDTKHAVAVYRRDRRKHKSPNAAQTESVCAGALGIRLAGPASYFGKRVDKPPIGDPIRPVALEDIKRAGYLMLATAVLCECLCIGFLVVCL